MHEQSFNSCRRRWPWPLIVCIGVVVLLDNAAVWAGPVFFRRLGVADGVLIGNIFGQASFAVMLCGLSGRTWLAGWLGMYLFVAAVVASLLLSLSIRVNGLIAESWSMLTMLPLLALGTVAPLAAARSFWGWSLTRREEVEIARAEHRVEDLFFFSIAVACAMTIANLFASPGSSSQRNVIGTLLCSLGSLLLILPVTAVTFRTKRWWQRGLGYLCITVVAASTCLLTIWLLNSYPYNLMREVLYLVPLFALTWMAGNEALLASGFRLTRWRETETDASQAASLDDDSGVAQAAGLDDVTHDRPARREARYLTASVAAITILLVAVSSYRDQRRTVWFRQLANPAEYFRAPVESIDLVDDEITSVTLANHATGKDLEQVAKTAPNIKQLSLAGTKFNDGDIKLLHLFPMLEVLDLSGTLITNEGVNQLPALRSLSLANTQVSFREAMRFANRISLGKLDVSGTGITDKDLEAAADVEHRVSMYGLDTLNLARNPLSDKGVAVLLLRYCIRRLDLSDTQVDGSCVDSSVYLNDVNLDGTQVNDVTLAKLLKNPSFSCKAFSLRRTQITAAILPALDDCRVRLGQGKITEADLMKLPAMPPIRFQQLSLNGPEFTGESLPKRLFHANMVDLSGSSVSDDILRRFNNVNWLSTLRLDNTNITAAALENLNTTELDLRGTRITGADLRKLQLEYRYSRILMRHEACTPDEIIPLRKKRVVFDQPSMWGEW